MKYFKIAKSETNSRSIMVDKQPCITPCSVIKVRKQAAAIGIFQYEMVYYTTGRVTFGFYIFSSAIIKLKHNYNMEMT